MTNIFEIIKPPFHYDDYGQMILDKDNNIVVDVRMWGLLSSKYGYDDATKLQDDFGKMLAETLTNIAQQSLYAIETAHSGERCTKYGG